MQSTQGECGEIIIGLQDRRQHMRFLSSLFERESAPSWTQIELQDHEEKVESDFIYEWNPININQNPLTVHLVRSWYDVHKVLRVRNDLSPHTNDL